MITRGDLRNSPSASAPSLRTRPISDSLGIGQVLGYGPAWSAALARQGRCHEVAGNLRVKEFWVHQGRRRRSERFAICHKLEQAGRDRRVRERLVAHLQGLIEGSDAWPESKRDELMDSLRGKPGLRRFLRRTKAGLRIDKAAIKREAPLDGKWLLRTNDGTLTPEDLAAAYKQLIAVERG